MSSGDHTQRPGTLVQPRRALVYLGALGCVAHLVRLGYTYAQPLGYGIAAIAAACGVTGPMRWLKEEPSEPDWPC